MRIEGTLTDFWGAECGREAAVGMGRVPGDASTPVPDAANARARMQARLLRAEGLAAGRPVHQHVIEQNTGEASKQVHRPAIGVTAYHHNKNSEK